MKRYNPKTIESKWQKIWAETKLYEPTEDSEKEAIYATPMLPYPSGAGLHVGHCFNYSIADAVARFHRQRGFNVMSNMGWDAFGLPTENYAIKTGVSPQQATKDNIKHFKTQLTRLGMSYAWDREVNTTDPEYYRWTQWIFTQLFKKELAYQGTSQQWWCSECKTVLANEQVVDGKCWRHDKPEDPMVERRETKQWFFKITDYADELLEGIDDLAWPESIKSMQTNWIGKSVGAEIDFQVVDHTSKIKVFTTRPDTLFGTTYMVLAPEHPLVESITTSKLKPEVDKYVKETKAKTELQRQQDEKKKTGVFTGAYAINPANGKKIPIWIADYVLMGYGTGAIMAVPAHDERDFEFAEKFGLPITQVVAPSFVDETNMSKQGVETVSRNVVCLIVKHSSENKFLICKHKDSPNWSPVIGGIEKDESPKDAAKRELAEETGFVDVAKIEPKDFVFASEFYAHHKQENRIAYCNSVYVELNSLEQDFSKAVDFEEHEFQWVTEQDYKSHRDTGGMNEVFDIATNKYESNASEGRLINSSEFDGMQSSEAREKIVAWLAAGGKAQEKVNYRMRDWLISRQRYWGSPIPIIHCKECGAVPVPDDQLPVVLPNVEKYEPTGENQSVLAGVEEWVNVDCPRCGGSGKRETDTMDGYACSSWYMYRYTDAKNDKEAFAKQAADYWFPVDFYFGGDHAVSHLLYFRFWHKFFADLGLVDKDMREPVKRLVYNGYINAEDGRKMSKSLGNVVDPLEIIDSGYGADALRTYMLFIGPYDQDAVWNSNGVPGTYRFLNRVWDFVHEFFAAQPDPKQIGKHTQLEAAVMASTHRAIKKVTEDMHDMRFNTAIAAQMKLNNELRELKEELPFGYAPQTWMFAIDATLQLLAPFAPHMTEELWNTYHQDDSSIHVSGWPEWDEELVKEDLVTIVVQINGKVRANITMPADSTDEELELAAKQDEKIAEHLASGDVKKVIVVSGKLVNFVVTS